MSLLDSTSIAGLNHLDSMKLWKALFYCVWHSDGRVAQQEIAEEVAGLCVEWGWVGVC